MASKKQKILRPLPEGHENVRYKTHLELRYLRWDYLVKSENPTDQEMKSKEKIVKYCAGRAMKRNGHDFAFMGMTVEDIENIARAHVVSYLSLYSVYADKKKKSRYISRAKKRKDPKTLSKMDNYSLISFLEQRLTECAFVVRQYCRGEAGFTYYFVYKRLAGNSWPSDDELIEKKSFDGWERVPWTEFSKIKNNFPSMVPGFSKELGGILYRVVSPSSYLVYAEDSESYVHEFAENGYVKSPEDMMIEMEEQTTTQEEPAADLKFENKIAKLIKLYRTRTEKEKLSLMHNTKKWLERRSVRANMKKELGLISQIINSLEAKVVSKGM